jgi:hypothetical protein
MKKSAKSESGASEPVTEHDMAVRLARRQVKILADLLRELAEGWPDLVDEIGGEIVSAVEPEAENMSEDDWELMKGVVNAAREEWCPACRRRPSESER